MIDIQEINMMYSAANTKMLKFFLLVVIVWVLVIWAILASGNRLKDTESWKSFHYSTPFVATSAGVVASLAIVSMCIDSKGASVMPVSDVAKEAASD
jgi:hypothetical protein